jgi:DNA recombination protein RmuC
MNTTALVILVAVILFLVICFGLFLLYKELKDKFGSLEAGLFKSIYAATPDYSSLSTSITDVKTNNIGLVDKIADVRNKIDNVIDIQRNFERFFNSPADLGKFGELGLEAILSDILPPDIFFVRHKISGLGVIPDAYIELPEGKLCIDSKFIFRHFEEIMSDATSDEERAVAKKTFRKNFRGHLNKIRTSYVNPDAGTAEFAVCYIPSESVYHYLLKEEFEMLKSFVIQGVQVASPLTLVGKLQMIRSGIRNKKITGEVMKVKEDIASLETTITALQESWRILYTTHLRSAFKKADEVNQSIASLGAEFDKVKG